MKINELISNFEIYTSNEEKLMLEKLKYPQLLSSFTERDKFTIEGMVRKSLIIKIGDVNPKVIANEF